MVVLEEGSMLTTGHNQYLQPDYLSPLPTTLDAKKSPLALLAQTCSQIGVDSPTKPLISPMEKSSKNSNSSSNGGTNSRSPTAVKIERTRSSPSDAKSLGFKPYETNVVAKRNNSDDNRPTSKASVHSVSGQDCVSVSENDEKKLGGSRSPSLSSGRKSLSPAVINSNNNSNNISSNNNGVNSSASSISSSSSSSSTSSMSERKTPGQESEKSPSRNNSGASPIIRSGMEVLTGGNGNCKDSYSKHSSSSSTSSTTTATSATGLNNNYVQQNSSGLCCPPGGLTDNNPAFRPPFSGASGFSHHHAAAAALLGYPTVSPTTNPYLSYTRVKTPAGGEALVPVCKDPYCAGCPYSLHNAQMMMGGGGTCPSGCTQCEHQKYGLAMALSSLGPMPPPSLSYPPSLSGGRPYVCNWIAGDSYCGKRFTTSDELLQHLRSHTSLSTNTPGTDHTGASSTLLGSPHSHPLLSPSAALHRAATGGTYPPPPLSPLSARYHPYSKPMGAGPLPPSLTSSPYSAFNILAPYYSPYTLYGQRIGAAVHP